MSSPCESQFNDSREMLQYWHNRPLVYIDSPDYNLDDFEFMETVGKTDYIYYTRRRSIFMANLATKKSLICCGYRNRDIWTSLFS
jgi:hypothetical protein